VRTQGYGPRPSSKKKKEESVGEELKGTISAHRGIRRHFDGMTGLLDRQRSV